MHCTDIVDGEQRVTCVGLMIAWAPPHAPPLAHPRFGRHCARTTPTKIGCAEHELVPEIAAAAIGGYLLKEPNGADKIRDMMRDDIHDALSRGDKEHASELLMSTNQV